MSSLVALLVLVADAPVAAEPAAAEPAAVEAAAAPSFAPRPAVPLPTAAQPVKATKTGRGMLIAGGVLTGVGVLGRIGLEVFWSTAAQLHPGSPFGTWSLANIAFLTNWNSAMFFGPGLGLLAGGAYRRGRHEAGRGTVRDARQIRRLGIGLLGGGLGLWALTRALMLPIANSCGSNACFYTTLESTFWISAGATFAGAAHLAYAQGYLRGAARVRVAPSLTPSFAGFAVSGRF